MPLKLKIGLSSLVLTLLASPGLSADRDDPWQGLKQLRRDVGFVFIERDLTCQYGRIKALTDQNILIETDQSEVTIDKSSLLRVRLGFGGRAMPHNNPNMALFTVFSGRSSWEDLLALAPLQSKTHPGFTIHLSILTKDGRFHRAVLSQVTDRDMTLVDAFNKVTVFPKTEISRVDYIRDKPLSDAEEFNWEELAMLRVFDPRLYPRLFHVGDTMPVRLYDSAMPEDNSSVECR
jgi:hypothetical protein